jgi:hypothetical protein
MHEIVWFPGLLLSAVAVFGLYICNELERY